MFLSSIACAVAALGGADDPQFPAVPTLDPVFVGEFGGYQDLDLNQSVDGLEDGTVIFDTIVRLTDPVAPQDSDFAFASRFKGSKYDFDTPWVHYEADSAEVKVLSYDLTYLFARIQVEVPVGILAGEHGASATDWPLGASDMQIAIGQAGSITLDDKNELMGVDGMATIPVVGQYPDVFARVDGGESAVGITDSILVTRHEGVDKAATYFLELFEEGDTALLDGNGTMIHFDEMDYIQSTEVFSPQEGSFRMRLSDSMGKVVFESKPVQVTDSDVFTYTSDMGMPNAGGRYSAAASDGSGTAGLVAPGPGGINETGEEPFDDEVIEVEFEIEEPPILLKLYSKCVPGMILDLGETYEAYCGACSTAQNPPEPNCPQGNRRIFYRSAYCKSRPWYLDTCTHDGFENKSGPTYRYVGKTNASTQGCTQVSIGISAKIYGIFGGSVSASKPRRRVCCEYSKNPNETGTANMRKCRD